MKRIQKISRYRLAFSETLKRFYDLRIHNQAILVNRPKKPKFEHWRKRTKKKKIKWNAFINEKHRSPLHGNCVHFRYTSYLDLQKPKKVLAVNVLWCITCKLMMKSGYNMQTNHAENSFSKHRLTCWYAVYYVNLHIHDSRRFESWSGTHHAFLRVYRRINYLY